MQQTLGSRLKQLRTENKLTQQQLAEKIGVSKTSVIYWEKDENVPKHESLVALANILKTTSDWLITGKDSVDSKSDKPKVAWGNVRPSGKKLRVIPLLDFVQAGLFNEVNYDGINPKGESYTSYQGGTEHSVFSLEIEGYSMSPDFQPGDEIVVDGSLLPKPGSLVIAQEVLQGGVAVTTFKKYRVLGFNTHGVEIIELVPLNQDFPTCNSGQVNISIIGVVVEHHRNLKY